MPCALNTGKEIDKQPALQNLMVPVLDLDNSSIITFTIEAAFRILALDTAGPATTFPTVTLRTLDSSDITLQLKQNRCW